ncbi:MAG TPA: hypothetical protein VLB44_14125 [Kofleriaceae bacterium]|nr:hypothetical protein [Kofleriaceae bacterium]
MAKVEADIEVKSFGYDGDGNGRRLLFPRAQTHKIEGRSGATTYGAADCSFEGLEGRLDTLRWKADAASAGSAWLRDDAGRFDVAVERAEFPSGLVLTRAVDYGIEILSPHVTFSELRLTIKGPFNRTKPAEPAPVVSERSFAPQRQERLRFLDSLSGRIYTTLKVQLDLPVVGVRTLDQQLRVPIQEGSLDYRALDDSLNWLEGTFLDIKHEDQRLKVQWKVPIVGAGRDLISWALDTDASTLASFGRVPLRSLADFRTGSGKVPPPESDKNRKGGVLRAFALDKIDVALSLLAPRHLEIGNGIIMFGGEDQPGMVDLKVSGAIHDRGAGGLKGAIGSIDTTIKDLELGPTMFSADRLHFDGLDQLEVAFDGFSPTAITMVIHRVTATNLAIKIGHRPQPVTAQAPSARSSTPALPVDRTPPR